MRKIIPFFVIITGLLATVFSILSILAIKGVISNNSWVGQWTGGTKLTMTIYIGILLFGLAQIIIGRWSWKKPRGVGSLILIILFGLSTAMGLYASITASTWPVSTIITLVLSGTCFTGLLVGFLNGNQGN